MYDVNYTVFNENVGLKCINLFTGWTLDQSRRRNWW